MTQVLDQLARALADRYRLDRELGAGGMATVYLAQDVRHRRLVAIKVLHPELSAVLGGERFLKEIELTASLQHPHILPLFDSGDAGGLLFYVMPYVEGETLRARLAREHQLPIADAIRIATDVAGALEYAHRRGVVHRDVKPENILLHEGRPQVADFGIALAVQQAGGSRMTQTGMSLGTPQYMAPEQAMGDRSVDARADVYALGAVTYEMLTGEPPFTGPNSQAIVAKLLTDSVRPPGELRKSVPAHVEAAVLTALEKLPADRFASAAELGNALGDAGYTRVMTAARRAPAAATPWLRDPRTWIAVAALAVMAALLATRPKPAEEPRATMTTLLPAPGTNWRQHGNGLALSPDGRRLAVVAQQGPNAPLVLRSLDSLGTAPLRGTEGGFYPFWSPDGASLGFFAGNQLKIIDLATGSVRALCPAMDPRGAAWGKDGDILYAPSRVLPQHHTRAEGGPCTPLSLTEPGTSARANGRPYFFPDGRHFLLTTDRVAWLGRLGDSSGTRLADLAAAQAVLAPPNWLLTRQEGGTYAQAVDLKARRLAGAPVRVLNDVRTPGGGTVLTASASGALVAYGPGIETKRSLALISRETGAVERIPLEVNAWTLRPSRDGGRVALGGWGLWLYDLERRVLRRAPAELDTGRVVLYRPVWGPGDSLLTVRRAYRDFGYTLYDTRAEQPRRWMDEPMPDRSSVASDWSPSGEHLLVEVDAGTDAPFSEIWVIETATGKASPLISERGSVSDARFSPDGRWIAYVSNTGGTAEVFLRPFPGPGPARPVSAGEGRTPRWRADGRELFFIAGARLMAVAIGPDGSVGTPVPALARPSDAGLENLILMGTALRGSFEPLPDGRFATIESEEIGQGFTLVQNWRALLQRGGRATP